MYSHKLGHWYDSITDLVGDVEHIVGGGGSATRPPGTLPPGAQLTTHPGQLTPGMQPSDALPPGAWTQEQWQAEITQQINDDAAMISAWVDSVKQGGGVPTRMPNGPTSPDGDSGHAGQLAGRWTGPGTTHQELGAPFLYILADNATLAADARITGRIGTDLDNGILNFLKSLGLAPGTDGNAPNPFFSTDTFKSVLLWGGIGVAALVVLPMLLPSRGEDR